MPSVVFSPIKVTSVLSGGVIIFGDTVQITPKSASKFNVGAGGGNTGDFMLTNSLYNITVTIDPDIADSSAALNN